MKLIIDENTIVELVKHYYDNDRIAIQAYQDGEPYTRLTVNLPDEDLEDGEMFVKNFDENEKIAKAVLDSHLFVDTGKRARSGYCIYPVWRLSPGVKIN